LFKILSPDLSLKKYGIFFDIRIVVFYLQLTRDSLPVFRQYFYKVVEIPVGTLHYQSTDILSRTETG